MPGTGDSVQAANHLLADQKDAGYDDKEPEEPEPISTVAPGHGSICWRRLPGPDAGHPSTVRTVTEQFPCFPLTASALHRGTGTSGHSSLDAWRTNRYTILSSTRASQPSLRQADW